MYFAVPSPLWRTNINGYLGLTCFIELLFELPKIITIKRSLERRQKTKLVSFNLAHPVSDG